MDDQFVRVSEIFQYQLPADTLIEIHSFLFSIMVNLNSCLIIILFIPTN